MTTAFTVDSKNVANRALFIYCICYITPIPMYLAALQKLKTRINKIRLYPVVREKQLFCQEKSQEKTTQSKKAVEKSQDKMIKDALSRKVSSLLSRLLHALFTWLPYILWSALEANASGDAVQTYQWNQKMICSCPKVTAVWKKRESWQSTVTA